VRERGSMPRIGGVLPLVVLARVNGFPDFTYWSRFYYMLWAPISWCAVCATVFGGIAVPRYPTSFFIHK
jgi:hypothetical protein